MSFPKVVVVGGGFAGLAAVSSLLSSKVQITLIDKTNHHLFQPLLYQVATSALSPVDIAVPLRSIFSSYKNVRVVMGEVVRVDFEAKQVHLSQHQPISYDYLVVGVGAKHHYFGHPEWAEYAPGLKTLKDALNIRERILMAFEKAEMCEDRDEQSALLTAVVVGGGPTGVEMAGAIAEIANQTMVHDFRNIRSSAMRVMLVEATDRLLPSYDVSLSASALKQLQSMGVQVFLNSSVTDVSSRGIKLKEEWIESRTLIWAAGNQANPLITQLGLDCDRSGRALVTPFLSSPKHSNVFVIGDCACVADTYGKTVPSVAPAAMQQGRYVGSVIKRLMKKKPLVSPFSYVDKGSLATIGKARAVASLFGLKFSGFFAWIIWIFIHILFLIGFRSKLVVLLEWMVNFITSRRSVRLITGVYIRPQEQKPPV